MNWLNGFNGKLREFAPLAELTWFRVGGPARWLVSPGSQTELAETLGRAADHGIPYKVLGAGANVLVSDDGFDGVVVRLDEPAFTSTDFDGHLVRAGGGVDLMDLTHVCARRGLSGLEAMAGIPGTVGGAVRMNAGGRHGELGQVVEGVTAVSERGAVVSLDRKELLFGYRSSNIGARIVVWATLRLVQSDPVQTMQRFREYWAEKKRAQPLGDRSAGCVFKNPGGASAGALIDQAGLKGYTRGGASVSARHANFIVTAPHATAAHVRAVIDHVRDEVVRRCGVELELEIDIW
ncbi:MAG: UDP-N-acetylmuramate dehydrogenase [Phycisphaerae bacterium]